MNAGSTKPGDSSDAMMPQLRHAAAVVMTTLMDGGESLPVTVAARIFGAPAAVDRDINLQLTISAQILFLDPGSQ